jgi:restriction system protein
MPTPTPIHVDFVNLVFKPIIYSIPWYIWGLFLLVIVGLVIFNLYKYYRLSKSGILEIDKMNGEQFEERLKILFTRLGYKAERTSFGKVKPDYGVDLVIEKAGVKTAVQAKCWKEKVGESAVQAVFAGKNTYNCTEAMVVTNSNFTKMAWRLAKSDNVKLWNRNYLIKVLLTETNLTS